MTIIPPDADLIAAVAGLVTAYSKMSDFDYGDPVRICVAEAIESLVSPLVVVDSTPVSR